MITFDATQQTIVSAVSKKIFWGFTVVTTGATTYRWSTVTRSYGGNAYTFRIIPDSFNGVELNRNQSEMGLQAPNELTFLVTNPANTLTATDFTDADLLLQLVMSDYTNEAVIRQFRFIVRRAEPQMQALRFHCVDYLQRYLKGDYPNTRLVKDIFPNSAQVKDDNVCVPEPYGVAYVPLRSVYIPTFTSLTSTAISAVASSNGSRCKLRTASSAFDNFEVGRTTPISGFTSTANNQSAIVLARSSTEMEYAENAGFVAEAVGDSVTVTQGSRAYVLGSTSLTYTLQKVRSPREWGRKSIWTSTGYTFSQYTKAESTSVNWRVMHPMIMDVDNDGTADAPGVWKQGDYFLDIPTKFMRSDTSSMTNPANVIKNVVKNLGVSTSIIGSTIFTDAETVYSGWGLTWNGAFWYKEPREKIIARLQSMCNSVLISENTLGLYPLSSTSKKTLTKADVLTQGGETAESSFEYSEIFDEENSDSGYVTWQETDEPQDKFLQILVPAKTARTKISNEVLELPFVQNSIHAQKLGTLHYQRKLLPDATIRFNGKSTLLALQPNDVITLNHADYGGSYDILIDSMRINRDASIGFSCTRLSDSLDNWADLDPSALTVNEEDTNIKMWEPPLSGPLSSESLASSGFDVWGRPNLIVGPNTNQGQYTSIQTAINALSESRHNGIYLLNGEYTLPSGGIFLVDRDIEIIGESQGGVILKNTAGSDGFTLHNLTKRLSFSDFTFESQNTSAYSKMIYIYGDTANQNTALILVRQITFNLVDDGVIGASSSGDYGVYGYLGNSIIRVSDCSFIDGSIPIYIYKISEINIFANTVDSPENKGVDIRLDASTISSKIIGNTVKNFKYIGIKSYQETYVDPQSLIINNTLKSINDSASYYIYGIITQNGRGVICSENQVSIIHTRTGDYLQYGIILNLSTGKVTKNDIFIDINMAVQLCEGISIPGLNDSIISQNNIVVDNADATYNRYGIRFQGSDRNIIQGNNIDMVNNNAKDIGIALDGTCDNNQGGDNITYRVGTSISDAGTGNVVTAQDV